MSTRLTADRPLGAKTQKRPPSNVAMRSSNVKVVGVPCRP